MKKIVSLKSSVKSSNLLKTMKGSKIAGGTVKNLSMSSTVLILNSRLLIALSLTSGVVRMNSRKMSKSSTKK